MPRKKAQVEILPPAPKETTAPATLQTALAQLVERKVDEALARKEEGRLVETTVEPLKGEEWLLQPWFRTCEEAREIKRRQTVPEQRKWSVFFEHEGCLSRYHKGDPHSRPHAGGGLCDLCRPKIADKLQAIVKELAKEKQL